MAAPALRGLFPARIPISPTSLPHCFENRPALRLFRIARLITSNRLRVLYYHGFALVDEYKYRGTLFIKDELFSRCMKYLKRNNYPIYSIYVDALSEHGWVGLALFLTILGYSW